MRSQLKTWLVAALIVLVTAVPLVWATPDNAFVLAFAVLGLDVCGVAVARRYFIGLARGNQSTTTLAANSARSSHSSAAERRRAVDPETSVAATPWQWVVHALGMGFGISAVLVGCYLADIFGFL